MAKSKVKSVKAPKVRTAGKKRNRSGLLGIRNKIYLCFIVPIIFMVAVGYVAYGQSSTALTEKYDESSAQTVNMAVEYLDLVCDSIKSQASRYVADKDFESYVLGMPGKETVEVSAYYTAQRTNLLAMQMNNEFIQDVHLIPIAASNTISTSVSERLAGTYKEYVEFLKESTGLPGGFPNWITDHSFLDEPLRLKPDTIFISYQVTDNQKMAYIIIDVPKEAMKGVLENMDFGKGAYVALITDNGKEIAMECGSEALAEEPIFNTQEFYLNAQTSEELGGSASVTYNGKPYLYIYQKSEDTGMMLCTMIPETTITAQAESIKSMTVIMVIAAALIAFFIGTLIAGSIQRNMNRISHKLDEVAKGDLTVSVEAKGKDEFQFLAQSATNMVNNNKNLIKSLVNTADDLQASASNVNDASVDISDYSAKITQAVDEINVAMDKQAEHALECVNSTNDLSAKIKTITADVESIEGVIKQAEALITQGMTIIDDLSESAVKTSEMTGAVGENIARLEEETAKISEFVQTISSISEQTNLLSLNASIEAARAGEAGRGFAVVAEEIRNLADNSSAATVEIDNKIKNINAQTKESVTSAHSAAKMVSAQQESVDKVIKVFKDITVQMKEIVGALDKIASSAKAAENQRDDTIDAVDNISAIIEQTAASSSMVRGMANDLMQSVDRLGATANSLDANMNGLKKEISAFQV